MSASCCGAYFNSLGSLLWGDVLKQAGEKYSLAVPLGRAGSSSGLTELKCYNLCSTLSGDKFYTKIKLDKVPKLLHKYSKDR